MNPAAGAGVLFLAGWLVLGGLALQYRDDPFAATPVSDALSYDLWAQRIAERGIDSEPVFHQAPLFPMLLAAVYELFEPERRALGRHLLQIFLHAMALALLVPVGRYFLGSSTVGLVAGLLALLYGPLAFHALKVLPVSLAIATQAAALAALGRARERVGSAMALGAGMALGIACLTRPEVLLALPVGLVCLGIAGRSDRALGALRPAGLYAAGVLLAVAPATLHNLRQGDRVLIAASAGENLFIGNQREARGGHWPLGPKAGDLFSQRIVAELEAERAFGRPVLPSEISRYWRGRAWDEIRAAPLHWLGLEALKFGRILAPQDLADIYSFPLERSHYLGLLHALPLSTLVLWILALAGLATLTRREWSRAWPLAAWLCVHVSVLLAFFVSTRLRLPLLFLLAPFAARAVVTGLRRLRSGVGRRSIAAAAVVLVALCLIDPWLFRTTPREVVRLAAVLSTQDRLGEALEVLEPLIHGEDVDALALDQAGWVCFKRGELIPARDHYARALSLGLPPARETQTRTRFAWVYERLGEVALARAEHDAAVESPHANAGTYHERGRFRLAQGDRAGARTDFLRAVELDPGWAAPREALRSLAPPP